MSKDNQVQFTVTATDKGAAATNVTVICAPEEAMYFGEIKTFSASKGFGFIGCEAFSEADVFVLRTELPSGFAPQGGHCRFKVRMEEKGPVAVGVQLLGAAGNQIQQMKQMAFLGWGKGYGKGFWGMPPYMMGKGFGKGRSKGFPRVDPSQKVWIGELPEDLDWKALQEHMDQVGKTKWVDVFSGKGKGTAAAAYNSPEEATSAIASLNGSSINGQAIVVDAWTKKEEAP